MITLNSAVDLRANGKETPAAGRISVPFSDLARLLAEETKRVHPFSAALREIASIPGARYSCVADDVTGDVLAEHGRSDPDPAAAVRWGTGLRAALRSSGELEDVMITAEGTYHLLRLVHADSRTVLVHLSVDRIHGNLALARRALGEVRFDNATPVAPQRVEQAPLAVVSAPAGLVEQRAGGPAPAALPVRVPRRPEPLPGQPVRRSGAMLSAVPPPRRPVAPEIPAAGAAPAEQSADVPAARGWSDDLYTMGRLLDALRRMK